MKARLGEQLQIARMVIMHVGNDHILNRVGVNIQQRQTFNWRAEEAAAPALAFLLVVAHIDDDGMPVIAYDPDEIVHGDGCVVRIALHEHAAALPHAVAVFNGVYFIRCV